MPTSAPHVCAGDNGRCRVLVHGRGPCPAHRRKPWDHKGVSRQARGYGAAHDRLRAMVLREERGCCVCGTEDQPTLDHTIPITKGGQTERSNLRRMCRVHQQQKASREGNEARR